MADEEITPEALARQTIDAKLVEAGWAVQDRAELNLAAGVGVAVREFQTDAGPCDYLLFVDKKPAGVIEAKKDGVVLTNIEAQTRDYANKLPKWCNPPLRPLPFLYESTASDTRFTNLLDPKPRSHRVFHFHQPSTLQRWLDDALALQKCRPGAPVAPTFLGRMLEAPPLNSTGMWPAQIRAVENLERSIQEGRPRALVQMATGSGKTFTTVSAAYRLIKFGGARRILFLVDRGNLGKQALKEFQAYTTPDDGRKFTELYNVARLTSNKIDPVNRVVITTIQRLYSILRGEAAVVGECGGHMSDPLRPNVMDASAALEPRDPKNPSPAGSVPANPLPFRFSLIYTSPTHRGGPMDDRWLSVDEIAEYLGVSKDTVYTWVNDKGMPGYKVGRFWKFKKDDVDAWVREGGAASTSDESTTDAG